MKTFVNEDNIDVFHRNEHVMFTCVLVVLASPLW